jgi:two-component system LytT family response regulator
MAKLLIADDEENVREALSQMVALYSSEIKLLKPTASVADTIQSIQENDPDIVLLDVEMKGGTGFDVLKFFKTPRFKVIFITAFQQYAIQAFRFSALDYLLKPVDPDRLMETLSKATDIIDREKIALKIESFLYNMGTLNQGLKKIILKTSANIHVVNLQDIVYCEADGGYTTFYLADRTRIVVSNTLGHYEEMFDEFSFLRVHASYLININYIKRYEKGDGGKLYLNGDICIPVASRKKDHLMHFLTSM